MGYAVLSVSILIIETCSCCDALMSAVIPCLSFTLILAPLAIKILTTSISPFWAAQKIGVDPLCKESRIFS